MQPGVRIDYQTLRALNAEAARERTWTNGLCFHLWVISWLRSHGVTAHIVFTVDHGEEFGGRGWLKLQELRKLIRDFGCSLVQNHLRHPEENAHLERSLSS